MIVNSELICKCLQSLDRRERQRALNDLLEIATSPESTSEDITKTYDETYLNILKCYSDKYESCRELATSVVSEFFKHLPKNDYYLQYVISTVVSRIGQKEVIEDSEELRLLLLIQLDFIIDKFRMGNVQNEGDLLLKCYDDIVNILVKELADRYPSAQRAACACIRTLAEATPSFHYRAESFVKPVLPMLHHKHSMNRISAIETLGIVALHIHTNSECVSQIITEISPLLMDPMPLVRKECGRAGCRMLMDLRDRYSFFPRILPLVLCCLDDDTPEVRDCSAGLWAKCGSKYYEENENELNNKEVIDETPPRYPENIQRPSLGCRAIVQRSLKVIQLILQEAMDWKEKVRLHSLKLLWQIILHAEVVITVHVLDIYPVLARACADPEQNVADQALKCAELMSLLMVYNEWFDSCLRVVAETPKLGFLKCFYAMFLAASDSSPCEDIQKLAKVLQGRGFSHNLNPEFQSYLLKFVSILIDEKSSKSTISEAMASLSIHDHGKETEESLYHIVVKVLALSYESKDERVKSLGREVLAKLAKGDEQAVVNLHAAHLGSVLAILDCLDARNDANSEPILLLHGIICVCGFHATYLEALKGLISTVWKHAAGEGKLKVLGAISIGMMSWSKTIGTSSKDSSALLQAFVNDIILPHLTWRPGANAESLRTMATASLCSMAQGAPEEAPKILSDLAELLATLVEDNCVTTRVYALRSLVNSGPIKTDHLRTLGYAVLQRLDDPSSEVRNWAARTLAHIRVMDNNDDTDNTSVHLFFVEVLSTLFLHFEGPELKLRSIIRSSIIYISKVHRDAFTAAFEKAYTAASDGVKKELNELKMECLNFE